MSEEFDAIVDAVMARLEPEYLERLDNLAILVLPDHDVAGDVALGTFQGAGLRDRYGTFQTAPNQIVLYEQPIRRQATTAEELYAAVQQVLLHELGHYFGLTHAEMGARFQPVR